MFTKRAVATKLRLRMALAGPDKVGKSFGSLLLATHIIERLREKGELEGNGEIAALDTEHNRLKVYADQFRFFDENITDYSPENFIKAISAAEAGGFSFLIIDSFTHEWKGRGGVLEIHSKMSGNSFANWGKARPIHNAVIERILASRLHVICTVRSRVKYVQEGSTVTKIGMRPQQEKDFLFEFDLVGYMDAYRDSQTHKMVRKIRFDGTRCEPLDGRIIENPGADLAYTIADWLSRGERAEPTAGILTAEQVARLTAGATEVGFDDAWWRQMLMRYGVGRIEDMTLPNAQEVASEIRKRRADLARQAELRQADGSST